MSHHAELCVITTAGPKLSGCVHPPPSRSAPSPPSSATCQPAPNTPRSQSAICKSQVPIHKSQCAKCPCTDAPTSTLAPSSSFRAALPRANSQAASPDSQLASRMTPSSGGGHHGFPPCCEASTAPGPSLIYLASASTRGSCGSGAVHCSGQSKNCCRAILSGPGWVWCFNLRCRYTHHAEDERRECRITTKGAHPCCHRAAADYLTSRFPPGAT
jgi:hypothetical protein